MYLLNYPSAVSSTQVHMAENTSSTHFKRIPFSNSKHCKSKSPHIPALAFQKINFHDIISLVCLKLHTVTLRQCFPRHILKASVISLLFHHYHQRHRKSSRNQGFTSRLAPIFKTAQWSLNCSVLSDTKICYWTFTNEAIFQFDWENTHLNTSEYCFGLLFMSVLSNWRIHSHSVPAVSQATLRSRIPQQKRLCLASKPLLQLLCCDK